MPSKNSVLRLYGPAVVCTLTALCGTAHGLGVQDECDTTPAPAVAASARVAPTMTRMMSLLEIERLSLEKGVAMCFVSNPTQAQLDEIMARYQALPPPLVGLGNRYFSDNTVWTGNGSQGTSGRAIKANLSVSFPADGPLWGSPASTANNLNATFTTLFGAGNGDRGRELIRQAIGSWRRFNGIVYTEVADDNTAMTSSTAHTLARGDIRFGCIPQGTSSGVLAYDLFPNGGADMTLNSDQFGTGAMGGTGNNYRYLRNVVSHEHGHGLGFIHPVPCDNTKLMEPFINVNFDGTQIDERRGAGRNYGDRYAGNNSGINAKDFGSLTAPNVHSIIERNLSTNGTAGFNASGEDWFKFTLDSAQDVTITATATGGNYTEGQQSSGCSGTTAAVNAVGAGNLSVELRNGANGATVLQTSNAAAAGSPETVVAPALAAGTYWARIVDVGPNAAADQFVQLYDMTIRVGTSHALPVAMAGINKRILANTNCFFMGNISSYATDTGASITSYAWDLDGDGAFGGAFDSTLAQPVKQYVSNGTYAIKLRVTDTFGMQNSDTVSLVVSGATAAVTGVTPNLSGANVAVPVTITGVNFKGITSASQVTVSGSSVTVTGTPVVNPLGTQITGLVFNVAAGAAGGAFNISVTNSDGSGTASGNATGTGLYTINANCVAPQITAQPQPAGGCAGGSVTFTCAASGSVPTFQWRKNTVPISGATSNSLTISPLVAGDAGSYDCIASNGCGSAPTNAVTLTFGNINIVSQPAPTATVCPGASVVFTVTVSDVATFQWQHDGTDVDGQTDSSITISPVTVDDAGGYNCIITTPCRSLTSNTANLTVRAPVNITLNPSPVSVCVGSPASFTIAATGFGRTYQWRKNTVNIGGATTPTLSFPVTALTDAASYDCVVTGTCGAQPTSPATLDVCSGVSVDTSPSNLNTCPGATASLSVVASGTALNYQWRKGGTPISGATASTLDFNPVTATSAGSYDCVVSNCCNTQFSTAATVVVCAPDFNCSGSVTVADIFDFLAAWFSADPRSDFNSIGGINVQDIFDFLAAWFAGC